MDNPLAAFIAFITFIGLAYWASTAIDFFENKKKPHVQTYEERTQHLACWLALLPVVLFVMAVFLISLSETPKCFQPPPPKPVPNWNRTVLTTHLSGAWEVERYNVTIVRIDNTVIMAGDRIYSHYVESKGALYSLPIELPQWAAIHDAHDLDDLVICGRLMDLCSVDPIVVVPFVKLAWRPRGGEQIFIPGDRVAISPFVVTWTVHNTPHTHNSQ